MEVFILKHDKTVIIVRLYREFVDLVTVEGEYTGIMTGKVELSGGYENGLSGLLSGV